MSDLSAKLTTFADLVRKPVVLIEMKPRAVAAKVGAGGTAHGVTAPGGPATYPDPARLISADCMDARVA